MRAARPLQLGQEVFVNLAQMRDIGQRVGLLRIAERTARPIREPARFIKVRLCNLAHQSLIANLIAEPTHHRRHLRIKQRIRHHIALDVEDLQILPRSVEDFDNIGIFEQLIERIKRHPLGQRVDQDRVVFILTGHRNLHQTQLREVGPLAQKLGVDGDVWHIGCAGAERGEIGGCGQGSGHGCCVCFF